MDLHLTSPRNLSYLAYCRKSWRPDQHCRSTLERLSKLTGSLRWMATQTALNSLEEITPKLWFDYLEIRLSGERTPVTVNGELRQLQSFLTYQYSAGCRDSDLPAHAAGRSTQ